MSYLLLRSPRMRSVARVIVVFPFAIFMLVGFLLVVPFTRQSAIWLLQENHPIEILSVIFLLVGSLRGAMLALRVYGHGETTLCVGFYLAFALGLLFTAMEEVAWGQKVINFETPSVWKELNAQGEMTLHNVHGLQGRSEIFRLTFGLGGLIGVWVARKPALRKIAAPGMLLSWFLVISGHSIVDMFNDVVPVQKDFDAAIYRLSELIEMLIGMAGFLYVELNARRLATEWRKDAPKVTGAISETEPNTRYAPSQRS